MADRKFLTLGFAFAGVLALAAAFAPLLRGEAYNVTFLLFGIVFVAVGAVTGRKRDGVKP